MVRISSFRVNLNTYVQKGCRVLFFVLNCAIYAARHAVVRAEFIKSILSEVPDTRNAIHEATPRNNLSRAGRSITFPVLVLGAGRSEQQI